MFKPSIKFSHKLLNYIIFFLLLKISPIAAESLSNSILIYNAASTYEIIKEISKKWETTQSIKIRASSGSSSSLAKQILNGAPANIFISASWLWIEELRKQKLIIPETVRPIFENKLVLITHKESEIKEIGLITNGEKLKTLFEKFLSNSRISIADPTHVPAGVYTKQALIKLDLWKNLNRKNMAWGGDVRRTLKFVALGNSPLGIVYYTDAKAEKNVKIIGSFSSKLHSPIQYWVTSIQNNSNKETIDFLSFLNGSYSSEIYKKYGFSNVESK